MARPREAYLGTDSPAQQGGRARPDTQGQYGQKPMLGPGASVPDVPTTGMGADPATNPGGYGQTWRNYENQGSYNPEMVGDGGGADPRVPYIPGEDSPEVRDINSENPYEINGGAAYDDGLGAGPIDIDSARRDVIGWVSQQLGVAPDAVGDMTLNDIQALIADKAPRDQGLRDALGTMQADQGMAPEDPSMGPGDPALRFNPDRPRY